LQTDDTVSAALQLMQEHHAEHLPVVDAGVYRGLVSEEEFARSLAIRRNLALLFTVGSDHYCSIIDKRSPWLPNSNLP
jgi:CBS domain-containing protein